MNSTVIKLGLISFFNDISSEMLYPVTPLFLTTVLGASMLSVGLIEGFAEATSSLLKTYFGAWSDRVGERRNFLFFGYLLSAFSKPLTGLSTIWPQVLGARSLEKVGKAIRTAPRDALLNDSIEPSQRGRAFGFHRGMDTAGAAIGPLIALAVTAENMRSFYFWAVIPALMAAGLVLTIKKPKSNIADGTNKSANKSADQANKKAPLNIKQFWQSQGSDFKKLLLALSVFALTNSSDAFLLLKTKQAGFSFAAVIGFYCFYNLVYAAMSPILGRLTDRTSNARSAAQNRKRFLQVGFLIFSLVYFGFSFSKLSAVELAVLFGFYGVYMAATEGVSKALAVDLMVSNQTGTALGLIGTLTGVATIVASSTAGYLWDHGGAAPPFLFGACGAIVALFVTTFI